MTSRFASAITDFGSKISHKLTQSGDSSYFNTNPRNRSALQDLKEGLASSSHEKRISALKKIIALMSNGKDVSSLFPEVISCMQSSNISQKKLVYIYIVNTSVSRPNVAILAVNTFRNDCQDPNPLIRSLALRTMSSMHIQKIIPYLIDPLKNGLTDSDPYCRRTAVFAVAKAYHTCPESIINEGFYDKLCEKIRDQNAAVVAAAVSALQDIATRSKGNIPFELRRDMVPPLLEAINGCSEWGQISILEALALNYRPRTPREAQAIIERCAPRLQHANSALVIAAIRVIVLFLPATQIEPALMDTHYEKLMPPLVSLLSCEPEIQFITLKVIASLLDTHPDKFKFEPSVFFYPYNDPPYVKRMKIECIVRLVTEDTLRVIVSELQDYIHDVDPSVSRYAVTAIGKIATYFATNKERDQSGTAMQYCTDVLLEILETHERGARCEGVIHLEQIAKATKHPSIFGCVRQLLSQLSETEDMSDPRFARSRNAVAGIQSIYVSEIDDPLAVIDQLYPDNKPLSSILTTHEDYHTFVSFMFRFLMGSRAKKEVEDVFTERFNQLLNEPAVPVDVRDRVTMYQHLYKNNNHLLEKMLTTSNDAISKTTLLHQIAPSMHRTSLMLLGSVSGLHVTVPHQLDDLKEEQQDEESDEGQPLVRSSTALTPSDASASTSSKPVHATGPPVQGHSDAKIVADIPNVGSPPKTSPTADVIEFDTDWDGLSKEGFIHKWHAYNGKDEFSFGRLTDSGTCNFEQVQMLMTRIGLKLVKERRAPTFDALFFCGKITRTKEVVVLEIDIQKTGNGVKLAVRSLGHMQEIMAMLKKYMMDHIRGLQFQ